MTLLVFLSVSDFILWTYVLAMLYKTWSGPVDDKNSDKLEIEADLVAIHAQ